MIGQGSSTSHSMFLDLAELLGFELPPREDPAAHEDFPTRSKYYPLTR